MVNAVWNTIAAVMPGRMNGSTTPRKRGHHRSVSSMAASSMSFGTVDRLAESTSATNGVHFQTCTSMTVTNAIVGSPSQSTASIPTRPRAWFTMPNCSLNISWVSSPTTDGVTAIGITRQTCDCCM